MASQFGILAKLNFLQNWTSGLISSVNPAIIHNIEKYYVMKKVFYLSAIENLAGDYLEFGVFTGSSFCHSLRCCHKAQNLNKDFKKMKFFGFDSFEGFGELTEEDKHAFYTDVNFLTDYDKVLSRVKKVSKGIDVNLVKGYFNETLSCGPTKYNISKARILFVDSDTYSSAKEALNFCTTLVQQGTYIILDDYFSYNGRLDLGVAGAFEEFKLENRIKVREVFTYGMGGRVFVVSSIEIK
jgi:O-methyltransferase